MVADAEFYIDDTNERVGTMVIDGSLDVNVRAEGSQLFGEAEIRKFKLEDKYHTLGLPQEALDNLANLSKEILSKVGKLKIQHA